MPNITQLIPSTARIRIHNIHFQRQGYHCAILPSQIMQTLPGYKDERGVTLTLMYFISGRKDRGKIMSHYEAIKIVVLTTTMNLPKKDKIVFPLL